MYENQVPVFSVDAGFAEQYSLIIREAARLNVKLSDAFNTMAFGFRPEEWKNPIVIDIYIDSVSNQGIGVSHHGYSSIYNFEDGTWGSREYIGGGVYIWSSINDQNIAVSKDGYFSHWDDGWTDVYILDPLNRPFPWCIINNNNIAISENGYWSINIAGWTTAAKINEDISFFSLLNNNNIAISPDGRYAIFNGSGWITGGTTIPCLPVSLNDNNILIGVSSNKPVAYEYNGSSWDRLPDPPFNARIITKQNLILNRLIDSVTSWSVWDGKSWSGILPVTGTNFFPYAANRRDLVAGDGGSAQFLNLPMPTNRGTIETNITIAKKQLVHAYALKYGAPEP